PAELLLRLPAVRQVPGDLQEAPDPAALAVQRRDDDVGPEPGPVLADPPALVLEPARGRRHAQLVGGPAGRHGLGGVEAGEVLADDLLGPVALDALRPGVPRADVPLRVEEEDGVIPDLGNQLRELVLAGPRARPGPPRSRTGSE